MRQNTEKQCPSSLSGEHLSVELADCPLLAALCPWRVLTQSPASQNLQCAHMRAHTCPNTHTHTHSQIHPLTHPCKTHWRLLCFAVCHYPVLIHKTDQGLIPASCLSPVDENPSNRNDRSNWVEMLLWRVGYLPNFLLPPSLTWILSSSARQGGS